MDMVTPISSLYKMFFSSLSTFETPPAKASAVAPIVLPHRAGLRIEVRLLYILALSPLTLVSVAPCLPGHGPASLGRGLSPGDDSIHASDRTSLNSCRTFRHASPAS